MTHQVAMNSAAPTNDAVVTPVPAVDNLLARVVARSSAPAGIVVGTLARPAEGGALVVDVAGVGRISPSSSLVPLTEEDVGRQVALGLAEDGTGNAVLLGYVWGVPITLPPEPVIQVDGDRTIITGEREIELRCGESAIVLTADGRIYLRGHYVTSHATVTQRILGGSVNVN